jgi:hypothetical protein
MKATLFSTNGTKSEIELTSFTQAQSLVEGLVEIIPMKNDLILVNEEGLILDLPSNPFFPNLKGNILVANTKLFNKLSYNG